MFGKRFMRALVVMTTASLVMAAAVFADVVTVNDVTTGGDATLTRSTSATAGVSIAASNTLPTTGDASGCNATGANPATVTLLSNSTNVAISAPAAKSYSGCGTVQTFGYTVASAAALGSLTTISTSTAGGKSGSAYVEDSFTVRVIPRAPTALAAAANGQNAIDLSWLASPDAADLTDYKVYSGTTLVGTAAKSATTFEATGLTADTQYCFTVKARFNDGSADWFSAATGSACATTDAAPSDVTAPATTPTVTGSLGDNGWYTSNATVDLSASDDAGGSGVKEIVYSLSGATTLAATTVGGASAVVNISNEGTTTVSFQARDNAGNLEAAQSLDIKIDKTAPSASLTVTSGTPGSNGWFTTDVTIETTGSDATSGIASCSANQLQTSETTGATFNGSCTDLAGWTTNAAPITVKLDKSGPVITPTVSGTAGTSPWYTSDVVVSWTVADPISGIATSDAACSATTSITADSASATTVACGATNGAGIPSTNSVDVYKDGSAPVIANTVTGTQGTNGWYTSDVTIDWAAPSDGHSGIASVTGCTDATITTDTPSSSSGCSAANNAGLSSSDSVTIKRDATKPTISGSVTSGTANAAGWYKTAPTVTFECTDVMSMVASCVADEVVPASPSKVLGEGADQTVSGTATDGAGNTDTASVTNLDVDLSDPYDVTFAGGPAANSSHYFGSVPAAPTCSAADDVSGLASCTVTGWSGDVGTHIMTATATDNAGRTATATRTYTVLAWTLRGFYSPVDMSGALNIVKAGSTVPLKFEIFAGATEFTTTDKIDTFKVGKVPCNALDTTGTDDIEQYSTGQTVLRYDSTGGQFIQNWQVPKASSSAPAGSCYNVTMTTDDGSSIEAYFKTK